ncbi:MAG: M48 family metalloprotease [Oscillatoriales cyanobacterium RM2_1_1]|nr:M48 family metalloprotease [Oscillatoriales cyanobacterium SM2_3_0]NJO44764.1 M48 family metalloprotease [Oscillatoriales cyanobacterium RM2_1_1]
MKTHSFLYRRSFRRWFYPLLSISITFGIWFGAVNASQALSWRDLIFQGIQVIQLTTLSDRQEVELGKQINDQLINQEVKLLRNREATDYINQIGQRLAQVSGRSQIPYTFQVVNDPKINAFATMGGFVYINTGLMTAASNEAELASVMAHEIGHVVNRHAVSQMKRAAIAQGLANLAGVDKNIAVQIGVELALKRPNSREDEYEADQLGVAALGQAGYDQYGAVSFMEKLLGAGSPPTFLSTHPATSNRIAAMKQLIDPRLANNGAGMDNAAYQARVRRLLS